MRNKISSFFAVAEPKGHTENIEQLVNLATKHQVDALVVLGDLAGPSSKPDTFAKLFKILGSISLFTTYPGLTICRFLSTCVRRIT